MELFLKFFIGKHVHSQLQSIYFTQLRNTSFFNTLTAEELWKGVTTMSNASKKRGRNRGNMKRIAKDLNRGQFIGVGASNMVWPGLNAPVVKGHQLVAQCQLPKDPNRESKLIEVRNKMGKHFRLKLHPLERGWSGTRLPGRSIGPPDPVNGDAFENFDTKCLELKQTFQMTAQYGRKGTIKVFCVTGNGNGIAGFAVGASSNSQVAIRNAKNKAGQRLMYIERYKEHTVHVERMPEGYGLRCHRAISSCCEVIGIKDLYAKVEGSTNVHYQQLADETGLFVVQTKNEPMNQCEILAAPSEQKSLLPSQIPDYDQYILDGKIRLKEEKKPPFYQLLPGWTLHLKKTLPYRNFEEVKLQMLVDYGKLKSQYSDKYPECKMPEYFTVYKKKSKAQESNDNEE